MYRNDSNASSASQRNDSSLASRPLDTQRQPRYRSRDFGIGYGTSSGYAARRGYAQSQLAPRFRLV
jgi:hypothetical protein